MGVSASGLPYDIGAEVIFPDSSASLWKLNEGTKKDTVSSVSIFTHMKSSASLSSTTPAALQHIQKLKTLRHPSIITYLDSLDTESSLVLVTEAVRPLSAYLSSTSPSSATLLYGIYTLLLGLEFLHSKCNLSVSLASPLAVVVDVFDVWKLNCFENTTSASASTIANDFKQVVSLLDNIPAVQNSPELLQLKNKIASVSKSIAVSTASSTATTILQSSCFYSDNFLPLKSIPTLHLLPPLSSITALTALVPVAPQLSAGISCSILPTLAKALSTVGTEYPNRDSREAVRQLASVSLELLSGLAPSLTSSTSSTLEVQCGAALVNVAAIADRSIRNSLLHSLKTITPLLSSNTTNRIFDHLLSGFSDSNPKIREATLKNLVFVLDMLDEKGIEKLLRGVATLQGDGEAGIRTNAIIFLGKLAPKLTPQIRNRALISAFVKAFQDPFLHCRLAGLRAAIATLPQLDTQLVVSKLLPIGVQLLMDRSADVRELMLQLMDNVTSSVRDTLPALRQAEVAAKEKKSTSVSPSTPSASSWSVVDGLAKSLATTTTTASAPVPTPEVARPVPATQPANNGWDVDFDIDDEPSMTEAPPSVVATPSTVPTPPTSTGSNISTSTPTAKPKSTSISSLKKSTKAAKPAVTKLAVDDENWEDF